MAVRWLIVALFLVGAPAQAQNDRAAQTIVHVLDYISVDYSGAVEGGRIKDDGEYKEMVEFATQVQEQLKALPENEKRNGLVREAAGLAKLIASKADAAAVAGIADKLRWDVINAYDVSVTPRRAPDVRRAEAVYTQMCSACHGAEGRGDGPAARGMDPPPANFHNAARMQSRSVYGLYNTITLGVSGTPMASFQQLSDDERWALAFFVARIGVPREDSEKGKALWEGGEGREHFRDLTNVATLSRNEAAARYGAKAALVQDYLRSEPGAVATVKPAPLHYARDTLKAALEAYERGERARAQTLAVSAYLEGFEIVEPALDAVDHDLRVAIEGQMLRLRNLMRDGASAKDVQAHLARLNQALDDAQEKLSGSALSPTSAAVSAFIILMREGLEAILVLAAIIAFLVKAQRGDALRYIHAGWIAALALGVLTWFIAGYVVAVSGANREMTEGVTALVSTVILLYVGWWLHDKSHARAWREFIEQRLAGALSSGTIWALASLSFLAVYREVFEMVLFYEALWVQAGEAGHGFVIGGFVAGAAVLALIAWLVFRYGVRLPIGLFFGVSSVFLAVLAVIFAGQGVAALQEAGALSATLLDAPRIPVLGIFPTVQSLSAQALVLALVLGVFGWSRSPFRRIRGDKTQ